jgi:hypothetical protein
MDRYGNTGPAEPHPIAAKTSTRGELGHVFLGM